MITEKISYIALAKGDSDNILKNPTYSKNGELSARIVLFRITNKEKYSLKFEMFDDSDKLISSFSLEPLFKDTITSAYFSSDMGFKFSLKTFDIGDYSLKISLIQNKDNKTLDSKNVIFNVSGKIDE